ncbi:DNA sulfur modification protein DndE [Spiribacter insolitus]|uniref:DNA sulfur modification protein DndE n=1 Tax=Spiribacter insolitus TaxID=3122417 RepID=UPI00349F732F
MSDIIRISEQGKRQLIGLKRTTKIQQWNILCRWALCTSLKDKSPIHTFDLGPMSNVEMTWETFCGPHQACIYALIKNRMNATPIAQESRNAISLCTTHIHRGVFMLSHSKPTLPNLMAMLPYF